MAQAGLQVKVRRPLNGFACWNRRRFRQSRAGMLAFRRPSTTPGEAGSSDSHRGRGRWRHEANLGIGSPKTNPTTGPHAGRQRSFAPDGDAVRSALRDNVGVSDGFRATPTQTRYTNRRRSCHCCGACSLHWRGSGLGRARLSARKHADGCLGNRWQARAARDGANPLLTLQCRGGAGGLRSLSLARMTTESHPAVMQTHGMTG